jgi:serine/threonine-protein kinase
MAVATESELGQVYSSDPELGSLVADRFRLLELLGKGGMGIVYRAEHVHMGRTVALKMLLSEQSGSQGGTEPFKRFQQEARAVSMLDHPNIVDVHDFGLTSNGQAYLSMDYIAGTSLDIALVEAGTLPLDRFRRIFQQACDALAHAHENGVVHRDIKPSNIMLMTKGQERDVVKIVDFGLVKLLSLSDPEQKLTSSQTLVGSPLYMSPEQCRGLELDHRSDIYSLGCVMYRCVTGAMPVVGETALDTLYKHISEQPIPFAQANPSVSVPAELETVIIKALSKRPEDRQQTMAELKSELLAALPSEFELQTVVPHVVPDGPDSKPASEAAAMPSRRPRRSATTSVWIWLGPTLGVAAVSLIIIGSLLVAVKSERDQRSSLDRAPVISKTAAAPVTAPVESATASAVTAKPVFTSVSPLPAASAPLPQPAAPSKPKPSAATARSDSLREAALVLREAEEAYAAGDWSNALASYQQALVYQKRAYGERSDELLPVLARMTVCAHRLGDEASTIGYFTQYAQNYSTDARPDSALTKPILDLARRKALGGDAEAADRYFKWALTLSKDTPAINWIARTQYAGHLRKTGQIEEAQAMAPLPNRPRRFFNRGN